MNGIPVSMALDSLAQALHRARNRVDEGNWKVADNELTSAATILLLINRYRNAGGLLKSDEVDHYKKLNAEWDDLDTKSMTRRS